MAIKEIRESVTEAMESSRYMIKTSVAKEYRTVLEAALEQIKCSLIDKMLSGVRGVFKMENSANIIDLVPTIQLTSARSFSVPDSDPQPEGEH